MGKRSDWKQWNKGKWKREECRNSAQEYRKDVRIAARRKRREWLRQKWSINNPEFLE